MADPRPPKKKGRFTLTGKKKRKPKGRQETLEEYLDRGGRIRKVPSPYIGENP